jgi:hypothetical protein
VIEEIKERILESVGAIPAGYLSDPMIREVIRCVLFEIVREQGLIPVPAFRNPRYPEGPVDIVGIMEGPTVEVAFCSNATIELEDIKRLERVPANKKFVITFSQNQKKVEMSKFFLKPGIEHIDLYAG